MNIKKCAAGILTICLSAGGMSASREWNITLQTSQSGPEEEFSEDGQVRAFALSPGYPGLPFSDPYGDYQWAFLNTGIFMLVPGNKAKVEDQFEGWIGGSKPKTNRTGPAEDLGKTTLSVEGMDINIVPAWKKYAQKRDKRKVIVALIDTGVDYSHEDLWNSVWVNEDEMPGDGKDNDGNGYIDDIYGWNFYSDNSKVFTGIEDNHGTHSAGTISAGRNGKGVVGICDPEYVKVMSLKTLGTAQGIGSPENVAKAIRYAEANGATICNLSFGTAKYSEELYQTMKNSKMLFIVAAGNGDSQGQGYDIDYYPVYPASFELDNVISVASIRLDGNLDHTSNYGAKSVDIGAPGSYILSTISGNRYGYMSGTSMAAPMVTGAAAMLYSYNPSLSVGELKGKILGSVRPLASLNKKTVTGGLLDVLAMLE